MDHQINVGESRNLLEISVTITNVILVLLALNLVADTFGLFSYLFYRLIAFVILLALLIINIPFNQIITLVKNNQIHRYKKNLYLYVGFFLILFGFLVAIFIHEREINLFLIPMIIFGLDLFLQAFGTKRSEFFALFITTLAYSFFILFVFNIPLIWNLLQQLSLIFSRGIGILSAPIVLGPSTSGLWMVITFLFFSLTVSLFSWKKKENRHRYVLLIISIVGPILAWVIYILYLAFFQTTSDTSLTLNSKYILFFISAFPLIYLIIRSKISVEKISLLELNEIKKRLFAKKWQVSALALLLISSGILLTSFPYGSADKGKIVFYRPGVGDFSVPNYSTYGQMGAGFFGQLPDYLNASGYTTEIVRENITADILNETLNDAKILMLISITQPLTTQEQTIVWHFVEKGGSLLVVGDHTDMYGIMRPLNTLLSPVGISFRFDSAMPSKELWMSCYDLMHHPVTEKIDYEQQIGVSVGASLNVTGYAFPVVIGKYSFSDWGDYSNTQRAYLGDYLYNSGEQLGDLILVAGATYGQGKVLVFADMTEFQNPVLPYTHSFINNAVTWLTSKRTAVLSTAQLILSLFLLIGAMILFRKSLNRMFIILFPIFLCISLIASSVINPILLGDETYTGPLATIDASHGELFNLQSFQDKSVDGLIRNLERNKYLPMVMRDFSESRVLNSKILIFIAPTRIFSADEIQIVKNFILRGGLVIISTGDPDGRSSIPFLDLVGFHLENIPLGPVPYIENQPVNETQMNPRFVDSYPIRLQEDQNNSFYKVTIGNMTYTLVAFEKYGDGGLLLISDSKFLLNKNFETYNDYWPGNVLFFRDILSELKQRGVPQ
jgi:hypothetical protein